MKKALRDKRVIIALIALILGAALISFLPWIIINYTPWFPQANINKQYPAIMLYFFALIFFLVGYLVGDIFEARDRKKSNNYSGRLDEKTREKKWLFRTAPYLAALVSFVAGLITDMFLITYLA